ncbi:MAG: Ldh family oxidoreductase, partial [Victivallales bacterium]|nr:Ldh family oxidoreductase [Victivallales bacterium]
PRLERGRRMKVAVDHLKKVSRELLESLGAERKEAELVTEVLVLADMRGIPTHGVHFLPMIAERIRHGLLKVPSEVKVITDDQAITHIDGGNGLGQPAAEAAMRHAIGKAKEFGVGFSLVRNTNHIGLLSFYSSMAAAEGMLGVCMCNSAAAIAPWGGVEPFFGTNPLSVAAPESKNDFILMDMATSVVARGKIRRAQRMNEKIPLDWAFDEDGVPTDDPAAAMKGSLMPIGGPKGYGIALFIDLISGLLSGSKYSRNLLTFHKPLGPTGVGVMTMAVDIKRFMPLDSFFALVKAHAKSIRESKKAKGNSRIYLPGEIEKEKERVSLETGLEINPALAESINQLMAERGLAAVIK